jgi:nucleoside-diphosphate-sugar epimerase
MAHLLIIGGSGFFGKSILDAYQRGLLKAYGVSTITIMARNANRLTAEVPYLLDTSIRLLNADIVSCTTLPFADIVIHAAASSNERNYISCPVEERKNILAGTYNFCFLATQFLRDAKIIYVSSGAVYGQQPENIDKLSEDFDMGSIEHLVPQKRDYAVAKRDSERAIIGLGQQGLNVSIARCFAFVGRYLPLTQHFAIGNFIHDGMHGNVITVKASRPVYRSYLHSDDLVHWLMRIGQIASPTCPIINVGSDEAISISDLAIKIANYFQVNWSLTPLSSSVVDRYIPSIAKAQTIGCQIQYPLDTAITTTVAALSNVKKL